MSAIDKAEDLPAQAEKRQGAEDAERIAPEKAQKAGKTREKAGNRAVIRGKINVLDRLFPLPGLGLPAFFHCPPGFAR